MEQQRNGTAKWIAGLALTTLLAVAGWTTSTVQSLRNSELKLLLEDSKVERKELQVRVGTNERAIAVLQTDMKNILTVVTEMRTMMREKWGQL